MLNTMDFRHPSDEWRGVDFWMLNDKLDDDELRFQLREMHDKGVRAFIARTYIGLKSDYPGPGFKAKMHTIVDCAKTLGMKLYLQAGFMPEAVPGLPEQFTACALQECAEGKFEFQRTPLFVNMLDGEAVRFYLQKSYEEMWQEFASEFGKTILSVWVDEPSYSSSGLPWCDELPEMFRARCGKELDFAALFHNTPGCAEVRIGYWNTVVRLLEKNYFQQVRDWCHAHNLLFSGHLMGEGTFHSNFSRGAAMMPFYRYLDVPGIDYLTADMPFRDSPLSRFEENETIPADLYTTPLQCVSAAAQAGRKFILCEMYGVSSENLALRDQYSFFSHWASFGINRRSIHGIFYSLRGRGKRAYPPHINYYQPYWSEYKSLTDQCARTAWFVSQGEAVAPILLLLPWNTGAALYAKGELGQGWIPALAELEARFFDLECQLKHQHFGFHLGDEFLMEDEGSVKEGKLAVGKCAYSAVVLPYCTHLNGSTLALLRQFAAQGGKIYALGDTPCADAETVPDRAALFEKLSVFRSFHLSGDAPALLLSSHRKCEDGEELLYLHNSDCREPHTVTLDRPARQLHEDGTLGAVVHTFRIEAGNSLKLLFSSGKAEKLPQNTPVSSLALADQWSFSALDPNALVLEFARFKKSESDPWSPEYPVLAIHELLTAEHYTGSVALRFEIPCRTAFSGTKLAFEEPSAWQITLNGKELSNAADGYFRAKEFETLPLPALLPGVNVLELRRQFAPLTKPAKGVTELFEHLKGVELEVPFLIGNFAVQMEREYSRLPGIVRLNRRFALTSEPVVMGTELTDLGYPFFAGKIKLEQSFEADFQGGRSRLRIEHLNTAVVKVFLNGEEEGVIYMPPYTVELKHLRQGKNTLTLELSSSLRNLLGPSHRPAGEYGCCFGGYGHPNKNWIGAVDERGTQYPQWHEHRCPDTPAWTDSFIQVPFGLSGVVLEVQTLPCYLQEIR